MEHLTWLLSKLGLTTIEQDVDTITVKPDATKEEQIPEKPTKVKKNDKKDKSKGKKSTKVKRDLEGTDPNRPNMFIKIKEVHGKAILGSTLNYNNTKTIQEQKIEVINKDNYIDIQSCEGNVDFVMNKFDVPGSNAKVLNEGNRIKIGGSNLVAKDQHKVRMNEFTDPKKS